MIQHNWLNRLLLCPHCGNIEIDGPHFNDYIGDSYYPRWWLECGKCPAHMEVDGMSSSGLIDAWNRRI